MSAGAQGVTIGLGIQSPFYKEVRTTELGGTFSIIDAEGYIPIQLKKDAEMTIKIKNRYDFITVVDAAEICRREFKKGEKITINIVNKKYTYVFKYALKKIVILRSEYRWKEE